MQYRSAWAPPPSRVRRRRLAYAVASAVVAVGIVGSYLVGAVPRLVLIGVFGPLALAFEFGVQAYESFCVSLALLGRYDFRAEGSGRGRVTDPTNRRGDQRYALRISVVCVGLAAGVTAILVLLL
ncbi:hypothetical protein DU500_01755 [Haloplanus rubicundus]|uniref:Uncharacterized protein n=1 Tax=Haloplanus rubicundus TaxID=1547898 RepID=A0A345E8Q9_9EURY|nr:hypothetical protein [Haloplanus rubicundus]AXG05252.1 hypothetical protein DU500_01755 [Haloplanus rubicundus]AXG08581.1 hypothetical protein DU484_01205 [Haloplanus rubicundus]